MFKRIISVVVSAVTVVGAIPHIPAKAEEIDRYPYVLFAGSNEDGAITINSNNVCINGNIATNGTVSTSSQNVNINGEITENAQKETKIFFNKIDSRYFASNVDTYFEDFFLEDANINVNIPIEAEGDISLAGNINITSGLKALNDINLSGNVENTQNSAICAQTGDIIINTDNVNLNGLVYAPNGCVNITAKNLNINSVIIIADKISINCPNINANYNTQLAEFIGNDPEIDVDLELVAFGDYTKNENSLNIYWNTTVPKGSFDIMISEDNENYELIGTVTDENTFAYSFSEIFEKKYIKVIETTYYGETYESVPFIILRNDDSYDVNFLDSDDDMLPDIYELKIGTDLNNKDTDNDGLTDFQEYIYTQTDPLIYDSVIEGIPDSDIDTDEDGLSNIDEISRGTYPRTADTDEDGLSDYDEINVYNTDPLNPDSDGDGLNDGSDVKLGLDPNNDATMGIPDEEYVVPQSINADNKIISSINTSDSPYELSVEINTNRDAEKELTIIKSGYSKVIENDAMLGSSVDISITDTCNPERIVVKYTIKEPYLANTDGSFAELHEFQGIRRLNIFKFNTETNMLIPIDTQFDENNNMLYAEVNELGTYCIMDMEIWLKNLGVEYKSYKDEPSYSLLNARNVKFMSAEPPTPEKKSFNGSQYAVYDMTGMTWEEANAYCNDLGGHLVTITTYDEQRFINNNLLKNCKNNLYWIGARAVNDSWQWVTGERFSYTNWKIDEPTDTPDENYIHMYGKSPETYISIGQWNNTLNYYAPSNPYFYATSNCGFICEWDKRVSYDIILPTNWKTIYLDGEISPDNGIDTDKDSLTDWEEVDTTRLVWNEDGSFDIPVFDLSEIVNHIKRFNADEYKYLFEECMSNKKRRYLPILSDPSSKDSDGDKIPDRYYKGMTIDNDWYALSDPNPLSSDVKETNLKNDFFSIDYEYKGNLNNSIKNWADNNNNNVSSYGGYQGWFGEYGYCNDYKVFCNGTVSGKQIRSFGCGIIAVADMFLYLFKQRDNCAYLGTEFPLYLGEGYSHLSFDMYNIYMMEISNFFKFHDINIDIDLPIFHYEKHFCGTYSAYLPGNIEQSIKKIQLVSGLNIKPDWCASTDKERCLARIKNMIKKDIPVVYSCCVSEEDSLQLYCFHNDCKEVFNTVEYIQHGGENKYAQTVYSHYMVATGVVEFSDDIASIIGRKVMLKTATFGKKYYVDYDEYAKKLSLLDTNIMYIEMD